MKFEDGGNMDVPNLKDSDLKCLIDCADYLTGYVNYDEFKHEIGPGYELDRIELAIKNVRKFMKEVK